MRQSFPMQRPSRSFSGLAGIGTIIPEEPDDLLRDGRCVLLYRKVSGVQEVQLRVRKVALIGFGTRWQEERVALAPNDQRPRSMNAHIVMPDGILHDVVVVVHEQGALDSAVVGLRQNEVVEAVGVRTDSGKVADPSLLEEFGPARTQDHVQLLLLIGR